MIKAVEIIQVFQAVQRFSKESVSYDNFVQLFNLKTILSPVLQNLWNKYSKLFTKPSKNCFQTMHTKTQKNIQCKKTLLNCILNFSHLVWQTWVISTGEISPKLYSQMTTSKNCQMKAKCSSVLLNFEKLNYSVNLSIGIRRGTRRRRLVWHSKIWKNI